MATEYIDAPEVKEIAEKLIPEFKDLIDLPSIKYLIKISDNSKYSGQIFKATGKWKYLTNFDYIIEVWYGFWMNATPSQKEALVYHELKHIRGKENDEGEMIWSIMEHDLEEFIDVAKKYGTWNPALVDIKNALNVKEIDKNVA